MPQQVLFAGRRDFTWLRLMGRTADVSSGIGGKQWSHAHWGWLMLLLENVPLLEFTCQVNPPSLFGSRQEKKLSYIEDTCPLLM